MYKEEKMQIKYHMEENLTEEEKRKKAVDFIVSYRNRLFQVSNTLYAQLEALTKTKSDPAPVLVLSALTTAEHCLSILKQALKMTKSMNIHISKDALINKKAETLLHELKIEADKFLLFYNGAIEKTKVKAKKPKKRKKS